RQVGATGEYDQPLGWTSDGREVVVKGEFDGFPAITAVPAGGGAKRLLYRLDAEKKPVYGPHVLDARYVLYGVAGESADIAVLRLLDLETGVEREITRTAWAGYTRYNPSRTSDRFLYAERQNGRFEFRAVDPKGESILLRAFPDSAFPPIIGVHGDRIAYWVASEEESTLFIAEAGEDAVREVMTFPGRVGQRGGTPPVWSPDGRLLASEYRRRGFPEQFAFVVEIDPYGSAVGEPRIMEDVSPSWWGLTWLPTSDAYLIVDGDVWLVPLDSSKSALKLTGEASGPTWWLELSPDGRQVAVAPEVHSGGSIWRLDLEAMLARVR
ncbi:MAG TPA: hypothetical protein VMW52_02190, partial [Phycisphaerae bacterium]|nr:hypothetical protein [Phycisphaerae bacterium]